MSDPTSSPPEAAGRDVADRPRQALPLQGALAAMQAQLRRHSPLEDLGPLFAPEAQGCPPSPESGTPADPPSGQL